MLLPVQGFHLGATAAGSDSRLVGKGKQIAYRVSCPVHGGNGSMLVTPKTPQSQHLVGWTGPGLH